ncbi:MAG TPA: hypothetical protein VIM06_03525 [Rhodanobacter sp.]
MRRLLSITVFILLFNVSSNSHAQASKHCGKYVISNLPQCIADDVYDGKDADMPLGDDYQMALELLRDSHGNTVVPSTISDMLEDMRLILPHWYQNALRRSRSEKECDVQVNGQSYAILSANLFWVEWKLDSTESPLRKQFNAIGINSENDIEQALVFGFCEYTKSGKKKAIEKITSRGSAT